MKVLKITLLLALIPTFLLCAESVSDDLYGYWYDDYTNTTLEIKNSERGLRVKQHGGLLPRWRDYKYLGRGVFDDYDGRVIVSRGYDQIEYRNGNRPSIQLYRNTGSNTSYGSDNYGYQSDSYDGNSYDYNAYNTGYDDYTAGPPYGVDAYCGRWSSYSRGYNIRIQPYRRGFRVRYGNTWSYYTPYRNYFRDRRGNRYYFQGRSLRWRSYDGRSSRRYRRR